MRILDAEVPEKKQVHIALTYIPGIGRTTANKICKDLNLPEKLRLKELKEDTIAQITNYIQDNGILITGTFGDNRMQQEKC